MIASSTTSRPSSRFDLPIQNATQRSRTARAPARSAALAAAYATTDLAGLAPPRLVHDAARHAFALGFVTLMIFGVAGRVLPVFGCTELRWPSFRRAGAWLIAAGVLLRQAQVAVVLFGAPSLLYVSGASGIVAAAGVILASTSILGTLAARQPVEVRAPPEEIGPHDLDPLLARFRKACTHHARRES